MPILSRADLEARHDFPQSQALVQRALEEAVQTPTALLRFMGRYTSWNGFFGSGVASLAGRIGRSRHRFLDPAEPVDALADRSVLVGSFFFDAARDEFDDRDTGHRDTHRCLAQAVLHGLIAWGRQQRTPGFEDPAALNTLLLDPPWLTALQERVTLGYNGTLSDHLYSLFRSMGYHLGSEVLADQEFSFIDRQLRAGQPGLVEFLTAHTARIAGQDHNAYQWVRIHSGHGGGAEADHFAWAVQGVERAFGFTPPATHGRLRHEVLQGFDEFANHHAEFFSSCNEP